MFLIIKHDDKEYTEIIRITCGRLLKFITKSEITSFTEDQLADVVNTEFANVINMRGGMYGIDKNDFKPLSYISLTDTIGRDSGGLKGIIDYNDCTINILNPIEVDEKYYPGDTYT